ncbi:Mitogen-activated protein kinase kinase kinase 10 [Tetrabaena socialis]|uniref:Mitogen-activated protein kinase kinase kinase 10 n=1 Tax=Tetrabaena socialis TaxID=47790 RepID=A0A2J8AIE3_9CHLO|nr:Mitogen-activated protein kinase kinase kinase 10 [Tetrabaena socialis]|eukprot:PNH12290.1 Mitogen-activated protein kinase kinase kinase 10 [Tetrabaena socialis]
MLPAAPPQVYSFGVLLWHMYTGKMPFAGHHEAQVAVGVMLGDLQLEWPAGMPPPLLRLGQACCRHEPEQRPTFKELAVSLAGLEVQARELHTSNKARSQHQEYRQLQLQQQQERISCSGRDSADAAGARDDLHPHNRSCRLQTASSSGRMQGFGGPGGGSSLGNFDAAAHMCAAHPQPQRRAASCSLRQPAGGRGLAGALQASDGGGGGGCGGALPPTGLPPLSPGAVAREERAGVFGRLGSSAGSAREAVAGGAASGPLLSGSAACCPRRLAGSASALVDCEWLRVGEDGGAPTGTTGGERLWASPFSSSAAATGASVRAGVAARPRLELPISPRGCRPPVPPAAARPGLAPEPQMPPGPPSSSSASTATPAATAPTGAPTSSRQLSAAASVSTSRGSPAGAAAAREGVPHPPWFGAAAAAGAGVAAGQPQPAPQPAAEPAAEDGGSGGAGCQPVTAQHAVTLLKPSTPERTGQGCSGSPAPSIAPAGAGAGGRVFDILLLQQQHLRRLPRPPLGPGSAGHSARVLAGYAAAGVMPAGNGRRGSAGPVLQHVPEDEGDSSSCSSGAGLAGYAVDAARG